MKAVTDEQLIRWVADGDPSCLATLFERHHRAVYQYCLQLTRQRALSEDLVQDVFLKMLKKARSFRGEGSFKAWMFHIARNVALDQLRKAKRQKNETLDEDLISQHLSDDRSAEQAAAGTQQMSLVMRALASLPTAAQEVIWLGRFVFDNYEELGQALDCKPGAARVRMHRAMTLLNTTCTNMNGAPIDV
ncbi:MAG: RNA polymerase sigma factor [Gammaproteobacteria bacterium]|nr:RNA polymerase sigma factor [Gammaproteobacteria bacterium]